MTTRIAHISDLHVLDWSHTPLWRFANKRVTGVMNLFGARRDAHPLWMLEEVIRALQSLEVDHVIVSGDLSNLSLESEFEAARSLLEQLGAGDRVSVVPGNHDVYTTGALRAGRFEHYFGRWMESFTGQRPQNRQSYPYRKDLPGGIRLYGLSSAVPAPPLCAWGRVGEAQLQRLRGLVAAEDDIPTARLVVLHHNLHPRTGFAEATARLRDRDAVLRTLDEISCDVAIHGHTHTPQRHSLRRVDGERLWLLGCGSSTWHKPARDHVAHFNVMEFNAQGLCHVTAHRWSPDSREFRALPEDVFASALARPVSHLSEVDSRP